MFYAPVGSLGLVGASLPRHLVKGHRIAEVHRKHIDAIDLTFACLLATA